MPMTGIRGAKNVPILEKNKAEVKDYYYAAIKGKLLMFSFNLISINCHFQCKINHTVLYRKLERKLHSLPLQSNNSNILK